MGFYRDIIMNFDIRSYMAKRPDGNARANVSAIINNCGIMNCCIGHKI
jgi:hypothetical protein